MCGLFTGCKEKKKLWNQENMFCPITITKKDFVNFHAIKAKPFQQKKKKQKQKQEKSIRIEFLNTGSLQTCRNTKKIPKLPAIPKTSIPKYLDTL